MEILTVEELIKKKWWQLVVKATELKIPYYKNRRKKTKRQLAIEIIREKKKRDSNGYH